MTSNEALAFDVYGTLVDPIGIWRQLEQHIPDGAQRVAEIWRQKQLEYTFRLVAMEQYQDFAAVTRHALTYALAATGNTLSAAQQAALLAQYNDLAPYPDVVPGLQRLQQAGFTMAAFSNGNPAMLEPLLVAANLRPLLQAVVSVDEVQVFKPAPRVYQHVAQRLGRTISDVRLISSNPFDVIGAQAAGMQATWIDRAGGVFDPIGAPPGMIVATITELADVLTGG